MSAKKPSVVGYAFKIVLCLIWGIPWAAFGLLLCLTLIGIPLGLPCFAISAIPWTRMEIKRIRKQVAYQFRDRPLYEEDERERPWNE